MKKLSFLPLRRFFFVICGREPRIGRLTISRSSFGELTVLVKSEATAITASTEAAPNAAPFAADLFQEKELTGFSGTEGDSRISMRMSSTIKTAT